VTHPIPPVDKILDLFGRLGGTLFLGEPVSQTEHALQTAWLAEQANATPIMVAAALLHDVGHLLASGTEPPVTTTSGDPDHAETGAAFLADGFPPALVEPIRLHVAAKRYLCTVEPGYPALLTPAARLSLEPQGGLMTPAEAAAFLATPFAAEALQLRRWDEMARVPSLATPSLAHFRPCLEAAAGLHHDPGSNPGPNPGQSH
jgi:gamma-butyrobetaine dioxygenase